LVTLAQTDVIVKHAALTKEQRDTRSCACNYNPHATKAHIERQVPNEESPFVYEMDWFQEVWLVELKEVGLGDYNCVVSRSGIIKAVTTDVDSNRKFIWN
jgi:hypothetical protein